MGGVPRFRDPARKDWTKLSIVAAAFTLAVLALGVLLAGRHLWVFLAMVAGLLFVLVRWHAARFGYRFPHCCAGFEVSTFQDLAGPHMGSKKYLRCPHCRDRVWARLLVKETAPGTKPPAP